MGCNELWDLQLIMILVTFLHEYGLHAGVVNNQPRTLLQKRFEMNWKQWGDKQAKVSLPAVGFFYFLFFLIK